MPSRPSRAWVLRALWPAPDGAAGHGLALRDRTSIQTIRGADHASSPGGDLLGIEPTLSAVLDAFGLVEWRGFHHRGELVSCFQQCTGHHLRCRALVSGVEDFDFGWRLAFVPGFCVFAQI